MGTLKRHVSWLESFPPDIWAYFVWYLPGEQLGRLMMTGATLLWQRLKSPTVVKSIKLGKDFVLFKSLPAFLRELPSLEELVFHISYHEWSNELGMMLDSSLSGLRKLELSGNFAHIAFELFGKPGATLEFGKRLPRLETLNLDNLHIPDYSWMSHSPQSLTNLSIDHWLGEVELPTSLIDFHANSVDLSRQTIVSKLPPALESFVVSDDVSSFTVREDNFFGANLVLPLLPPSIRKLSLGFESDDSVGLEPPLKLLERLPQTLTWLSIPEIDGIDFESNPNLTVLLPSTLTELRLDHLVLPCSAWPLLPQNLRTLYFLPPKDLSPGFTTAIDEDGVEYEVSYIPFESLPRSITSLKLGNYSRLHFSGPPSVTNQSYFPPQLTYLSLSNIHLSQETVKVLPSSLTYLKVGNLCEQVCQHLPDSLKILEPNGTLMSPNLFKFLPKSLTSLKLYLIGPDCQWYDCNTGAYTNDALTLPEYTIHEICTSNSFDWKDASPLPPTLTCVRISNGSELGDSFLKYQHLPNLLELDLRDSEHFTDLSIPLLPPHLTTLNMSKSHRVSGKSFPFLPRCLTYLNLENSKSVFDSDIQHLPRTLKQLLLHRAIHLTDLCVPELPPHLEELNLSHNLIITPSSLSSFPYAIRSAQHKDSVFLEKWKISRGVVSEVSETSIEYWRFHRSELISRSHLQSPPLTTLNLETQ